MGRRQTDIGFFGGKFRERYDLEDLDVDGKVILKWIFKK
jgi:hypothetical protein